MKKNVKKERGRNDRTRTNKLYSFFNSQRRKK